MLRSVAPLILLLLLGAAERGMVDEPNAPILQLSEQTDSTRFYLIHAFSPKAMYAEGKLVFLKLVAPWPSTFGLGDDHPLLPVFRYQKAMADAHNRMVKEDAGYQGLVERAWLAAQKELPLDISDSKGREILYRRFLEAGIYARLLQEVGPPPPVPETALRDPSSWGRKDKRFFQRAETVLPAVAFPPSLMIFRYCSEGIRYDAPPENPFRQAHDRSINDDVTYRETFNRAAAPFMNGGDPETADNRRTQELRKALFDAGIHTRLESAAGSSQAAREGAHEAP